MPNSKPSARTHWIRIPREGNEQDWIHLLQLGRGKEPAAAKAKTTRRFQAAAPPPAQSYACASQLRALSGNRFPRVLNAVNKLSEPRNALEGIRGRGCLGAEFFTSFYIKSLQYWVWFKSHFKGWAKKKKKAVLCSYLLNYPLMLLLQPERSGFVLLPLLLPPLLPSVRCLFYTCTGYRLYFPG